MLRSVLPAAAAAALAPYAAAHDTWVQPNAAVVRTGDAVHLALMLGNHGNGHRDFKLAGKVGPASVGAFEVVAPGGKRYDLRPDLVDLGYTPKEGFLSARFVPADPGLYAVAQASDRVVVHGDPVRSVKSAKAYFVASASLDRLPASAGFDAPLGHPFELVPEVNPVAPMGPGRPLKVRLLADGKPLAGATVSFIPRGVALKDGTDPDYDRTTDADGRAAFTPTAGNYYLIVAHRHRPDRSGDGYVATKYSATLTVLVPETCPCCGD